MSLDSHTRAAVVRHRAIPAHVLDPLTDGPSKQEVEKCGLDNAVFRIVNASALSAWNRGWTEVEWVELVQDPRRQISRLIRLKKGRARPGGEVATRKWLARIWSDAEKFARQNPPVSAVDLSREASRRAAHARAWSSDADRCLEESDRAVLLFLADICDARGSTWVTCARAAMVTATGYGKTAVDNALSRLERDGYIFKVEKGAPAGPSARMRRARVLEIAPDDPATASPSLEKSHVAPRACTSGAPESPPLGAGPRIGGAPNGGDMDVVVVINGKAVAVTPEQLSSILAIVVSTSAEPLANGTTIPVSSTSTAVEVSSRKTSTRGAAGAC